MNCPHCTTALKPATYEGVTVHTCHGCGGEFIGQSQLAAIITRREIVFGKHLRMLFDDHKPTFGIPKHEVKRDFSCPSCRQTLSLVNYGTDTGICVDRCGGCGGVWLDSQELEKVQIVVENWQDAAPRQLKLIAGELEDARQAAARKTTGAFKGSRFSFVNAVINRLLDAA
jgi:Zn-finger nucleic acid-binding protein